VNAESLRKKNKLLAELLEQPSKIAPQRVMDDEDADQPLNLCLRDVKKQQSA
jgi:hypothetical protein